MIKESIVLLLFVLIIGLFSSGPISSVSSSAPISLESSEIQNKVDSGQTQSTMGGNSSDSSHNQTNKGGLGPLITPIQYTGPVWSFMGPTANRNGLPTSSTASGAACSGDQGGDSDGDAICDKWESLASPNDATHRFIKCPTNGPGVYLDPECQNTTSKYNLCFKDQYANVWVNPPPPNPPAPIPHQVGDPICPKNGHKDVFVEIDYMEGHRPDDNAIKDVIRAFGNAPVTNAVADDFGRQGGITLHVILDEQLARVDPIWAWQDNGGTDDRDYTNDYKSIKERHFGFSNNNPNILIPPELANPSNERAPCPQTAACDPTLIIGDKELLLKHYVYHYNLYAVDWIGTPVTSCGPAGTPSGVSETQGNDFIVSLGCNFGTVRDPQGSTVGTKDQQAGTFMHELGHNLNLGHGGPALPTFGSSNYNINCKPNELSVMSYSRQVPGSVSETIWETYNFLDYSRSAVKTLPPSTGIDPHEGTPSTPTSGLNEPDGLNTIGVIVYGTPLRPTTLRTPTLTTPGGIDWDGLDSITGTVFDDVNDLGIPDCDDSVGPAPPSGPATGQTHKTMDEWNNLQYYFLDDPDGRDGMPSPDQVGDVTAGMVKKLEMQAKGFSGLLPPINFNGSSSFKVGDPISIKFQLRDPNGTMMENAKITFTAERVNGSIPGSNLSSSVNGSQATLFHYDIPSNTYTYKWQTSNLQDGSWAIRCFFYFGNVAKQSMLQGPPPIPSGMTGTLILKP